MCQALSLTPSMHFFLIVITNLHGKCGPLTQPGKIVDMEWSDLPRVTILEVVERDQNPNLGTPYPKLSEKPSLPLWHTWGDSS